MGWDFCLPNYIVYVDLVQTKKDLLGNNISLLWKYSTDVDVTKNIGVQIVKLLKSGCSCSKTAELGKSENNILSNCVFMWITCQT